MEADIRILERGDPPPWEDIGPAYHVTDGLRWGFLQGGMESGDPSVAIAIPLGDGRWACVETSYHMFEMVAAAFLGAAQRWGVR